MMKNKFVVAQAAFLTTPSYSDRNTSYFCETEYIRPLRISRFMTAIAVCNAQPNRGVPWNS